MGEDCNELWGGMATSSVVPDRSSHGYTHHISFVVLFRKEGWVGLGRRNFWRLPERVGEVGKKTSPLPHPTNESGCPPNRMVRFQWLFFAYRNFIFFTAVVLVIGKTQGLGMLAIDLFHALYFHCGLCFLVALKLAVRSPAAQRRLFSDAERRDEEILYGWIPFHRPVAQFETDLAMRRTQLVI